MSHMAPTETTYLTLPQLCEGEQSKMGGSSIFQGEGKGLAGTLGFQSQRDLFSQCCNLRIGTYSKTTSQEIVEIPQISCSVEYLLTQYLQPSLFFNVLLLQKKWWLATNSSLLNPPLKSDHVCLALVVLKTTTLLFADAGRMSVERQESRRFRLVLAVNSWEPSSTRLVMLLAFGTSRADKIAITIFEYSRKISRLMQLTSSVSILRYICDFHS